MDDLPDQLRAAVAGAPPTRIDIDHLIATEHRRSRTMAWSAAGTGAAALVAAVLILPGALADGAGPGTIGGPAAGRVAATAPPATLSSAPAKALAELCAPVSPQPSGPPAPVQSYDTVRDRPLEAPETAVPRLTAALRAALTAALPSGTAVQPILSGCRAPQFQYDPSRREYAAVARLTRADRTGALIVEVNPTASQTGMACIHSDDPRDCERSELPDGTRVTTQDVQQAGPAGMEQRSVLLLRPDGTTVRITVTNTVESDPDRGPVSTGKRPPLDLPEMVALGEKADLTLYP